jgi:hypothetical protein
LANFILASSLFLEPFIFLDKLLCALFNLFSDLLKYLGGYTGVLSVVAINLRRPTSIPIALYGYN